MAYAQCIFMESIRTYICTYTSLGSVTFITKNIYTEYIHSGETKLFVPIYADVAPMPIH